MTKEFIVYTKWLARDLVKQGFPIVRVERNPKKPNFNCYVFAETEDFIKAFLNTANSK